jgi:hypothetical protein
LPEVAAILIPLIYFSGVAACVRPRRIRGKDTCYPIALNVADDLGNADGG